MTDEPDIRVRRIYEPAASDDGQRVLVDRVWPRGISKDRAELTEWCKEVSPSTELRTWYGHDPDRYDEFTQRYREELDQSERASALDHLRELAAEGTLTLLTATKEPEISQAAALAEVLKETDL